MLNATPRFYHLLRSPLSITITTDLFRARTLAMIQIPNKSDIDSREHMYA